MAIFAFGDHFEIPTRERNVKIIRLDLKAFGCFTDASLDFGPDGGAFHVIYGLNEAGKSTALRAVSGLLYGIPSRTSDDFKHEARNIRIAAELLRANGQRAIFTRRKGLRDTLTDGNGQPVSEALLREFLGGASEEIFSTLFRLDHIALTQGGKELLEGKGSLAESLFQVGAGIVSLRQTLKALEEECGGLFKSGGSIPLVNKAVADYDAACKIVREQSVAPRVYREKLDLLDKQQTDLNELEKQIAALFIEKSRLERLNLSLRDVTLRNQLQSARATLVPVGVVREPPLLAESASRDRENAQNQRQVASEHQKTARRQIGELQDRLNGLVAPQELLTQAKSIASLNERLDSFRQSKRDLPSVQEQQRQEQSAAVASLRELRPDLPLEQAESLRLSATQSNRIRSLAEQFPKLDERRQNADRAIETAEQDWRKAQQCLEETPISPNPADLEICIDRVRDEGDLEQTLRSQKIELQSAEIQIDQEMRRLPGWSGTLDQFESLQVPAIETIERFENNFARLDNEQKILDKQIEKTRQQIAKLVAELNALRLSGSVPTEQELLDTRDHREHGWRLIRRTWLNSESDAEQEKAFAGERSLADAYEATVGQADTIADRLRREAERVAQQAGWLAEKQNCEQHAEELIANAQKLTEQRAALERQWQDIWRPSGVAIQSPREMRAWLTGYMTLLAQARAIREKR
ncbi:MAG: AAA family ATPase [Planctomycetota bacterium]